MTILLREDAIKKLATNQLSKCLEDHELYGDITVLFSFITGESKAYNLLTDEQLETEYLEDFNIKVIIR